MVTGNKKFCIVSDVHVQSAQLRLIQSWSCGIVMVGMDEKYNASTPLDEVLYDTTRIQYYNDYLRQLLAEVRYILPRPSPSAFAK